MVFEQNLSAKFCQFYHQFCIVKFLSQECANVFHFTTDLPSLNTLQVTSSRHVNTLRYSDSIFITFSKVKEGFWVFELFSLLKVLDTLLHVLVPGGTHEFVILDQERSKIVKCSWKLLLLCLFVILNCRLWIRFDDELIEFVLDSVFIDETKISHRIQMTKLGSFFIVLNGSSDLGLSIGVLALKFLF